MSTPALFPAATSPCGCAALGRNHPRAACAGVSRASDVGSLLSIVSVGNKLPSSRTARDWETLKLPDDSAHVNWSRRNIAKPPAHFYNATASRNINCDLRLLIAGAHTAKCKVWLPGWCNQNWRMLTGQIVLQCSRSSFRVRC